MQTEDLPAIFALQGRAYPPAYHELPAVLASRLAQGGGLCFVAETGAALTGYVFAHPWAGLPPALHRALPECAVPDHVFLHDLAVCPQRRGTGTAQRLIDAVRQGTPSSLSGPLRLVAIGQAQAFWLRHGFSAIHAPIDPGYGNAQYMGSTRR